MDEHLSDEPEPPPSAEERIAALEDENERLAAENEALKDRLLRLAAELDNWRKRVDRERAEAERQAREAVLLDLLEVTDALERALASLQENVNAEAVRDGVALVLRALHHKLERYGITRVEAEGQPFDPRVHEAIAKEPSHDVEPGTVLSETQKGYALGQRLLRPASVVVAEPPASAPPGRQAPPPTPRH